MRNRMGWLVGFGSGAALMYFLAPDEGSRRRARARDRLNHFSHAFPQAVSVVGRDLAHRGRGVLAHARSSIRSEKGVADVVIEERVRAKIGRAASHPHAIEVRSNRGVVTLRGVILSHELSPLLESLSKVRGVKEVENRLEAHKQDDRIPSLQGGVPRRGETWDFLQSRWSPSTRLLFGALGLGLGAFAFSRRGRLSPAFGAASVLTLARSVSNLEMRRILGVGGGREGVRFHKTIRFAAPVESVYRFWSNFQDFGSFMTEVSGITKMDERRSRWRVRGPLGLPIRWVAEVPKYIPNEIIAWHSAPGSLVRNAGKIRFFPDEKGGTKVEFDFSYNPPGGLFGHWVAKLMGRDPKRLLERSLSQMKQIIEHGPSEKQARVLRSRLSA